MAQSREIHLGADWELERMMAVIRDLLRGAQLDCSREMQWAPYWDELKGSSREMMKVSWKVWTMAAPKVMQRGLKGHIQHVEPTSAE